MGLGLGQEHPRTAALELEVLAPTLEPGAVWGLMGGAAPALGQFVFLITANRPASPHRAALGSQLCATARIPLQERGLSDAKNTTGSAEAADFQTRMLLTAMWELSSPPALTAVCSSGALRRLCRLRPQEGLHSWIRCHSTDRKAGHSKTRRSRGRRCREKKKDI